SDHPMPRGWRLVVHGDGPLFLRLRSVPGGAARLAGALEIVGEGGVRGAVLCVRQQGCTQPADAVLPIAVLQGPATDVIAHHRVARGDTVALPQPDDFQVTVLVRADAFLTAAGFAALALRFQAHEQ